MFDKSSLLYGLHEARTSAALDAQPVIVEGPVDVIAVAAATRHDRRHGHTLLPVAACGTAFTAAHARQVADLGTRARAVVAMDADAAGRAAAISAGELLRQVGLEARVAVLPNGLDPAEWLAHGGSTAAFTYTQALPLLTVQVERAIAAQGERMRWVEGRLDAGRCIAHYLSSYPPEHAARHIAWISHALDLTPSSFTDQLTAAYRTPHQTGGGSTLSRQIEPTATPAMSGMTR